jgi:pyruvate/2-oxoglutarate/acetoin dehydrogenase E1 component
LAAVKKEGSDLTIVTYGAMVEKAKASASLKRKAQVLKLLM